MRTNSVLTDIRRMGLVLSGLMMIGCTNRSVSGKVVPDDGRIAVPCAIEMRDPKSKDRPVIGLLRTRTGESFDGRIERQPPHSPFHPISDTHELTLRCDGYAPVTRRFSVQELWEGAEWGDIRVHPVGS